MGRLVPSLLFAIFLVSSHHLATCLSTSADIYESHDEDSGMITPAFEESTNLEEEQRSKPNNNNAHNDKNLSADNNDDSNTSVERLLQQAWKQEMLNLVNEERRQRNIAELCLNSELNAAALVHSVDMVDNGFFSHTGSDESNAGQRMTAIGYEWWAWGENIAINASVEKVHEAWMLSQGHRENILGPEFDHMGLGRVISQGQQYHTQVFGKSHTEICMITTNPDGPPLARNQCVDSPLTFKTKLGKRKIGRKCSWAAKKKSARCKLVGVSENCPSTCGRCSCVDSPVKFSFWFNRKYITQNCRWIARKKKKIRCAIGGVSRACRKTCGTCS